IKAGAQQAAKDTGSTLKYSADPDATKQAVLIQNAIDSKVDGIATTLVTPDALIPTVKKAGATKILCTIQQTGSVALEDRCKGVKDSFPNTENLQVNGADDSAVTSAIQAKLAEDKSINW